MRSSYEGDKARCDALLAAAQHEFVRTKARGIKGQTRRAISAGYVTGEVIITVGEGIDGIHVISRKPEENEWPGIPTIYSGAVIDDGVVVSVPIPNSEEVYTGLDAYVPTTNSKVEFSFKHSPMLTKRLAVFPHVSMPVRLPLDGFSMATDSQYTLQKSSKYTGKMSKLVQVVLGYGHPKKNKMLTRMMEAIAIVSKDARNRKPSILWSKENVKNGVQNNYGWEYNRTNGIYTQIIEKDGKITKKYWLIGISVAMGVQAMPLQLEPYTDEPLFRALIEAEVAKEGHQKYLDDILDILKEFGGMPTNEAFLTRTPYIKHQIMELLSPAQMDNYTKSRGVSTDHGWAFNDGGTSANTICLETKGEGRDEWLLAHHCQIDIKYDEDLKRLVASFSTLESGSAPLGHGVLKVGDSVYDNCVTYNADMYIHGNFAGRPKATGTAMFVFWKNDILEVLRWTDGTINEGEFREEITKEEYPGFMTMYYKRETWNGAVGKGAGFFCTSHDARIPCFSGHTLYETKYEVLGERERVITYSSATDEPEYFSRTFYTTFTEREEYEGQNRMEGCCAFVPLGERSAFYITTMVTKGDWSKQSSTQLITLGDPYIYDVRDTYIWNWDFGTKCGSKYPVTYAGMTIDGIVTVRWDRSGSTGKYQLDHYCQYYIEGPEGSVTDSMKGWSAATGKSEWYSVGAEPITEHHAFSGTLPPNFYDGKGERTTLTIFLMSMEKTGVIKTISGSYLQMYRDYFYWFDPSPNEDGDFQTMWATRNCFGTAKYQLYSKDVNDRALVRYNGYPLDERTFPTFIGVVADLVA